jgi:predicted ATPase
VLCLWGGPTRVLFVDLVDFTGIAERLDPEDLKRVVVPYLDRVRGGIERFGGHLEKYIGDAEMALFGAPVAYGDDPERALRAALREAPGRPRVELVGREAELGHLRSLIAPPAAEGPRIVTLVGPPGVGKSRLLWELCQEAEEEVLWRQGRCFSYGAGVSFSAFAAVVKSHAGILESDPVEDVERKLAQAVGAAIDDQSSSDWVEVYLRPLVGLGGAERLSGDRRAEAFSAWRRFLEALAAQRPVVLALEDVHWADDGLLDFVEHVGDWAQGVPLTVFCTARPELLERRRRWPGVFQLEPLSADDTGALLEALLGPEQLGPELRAELIARVGGNPL